MTCGASPTDVSLGLCPAGLFSFLPPSCSAFPSLFPSYILERSKCSNMSKSQGITPELPVRLGECGGQCLQNRRGGVDLVPPPWASRCAARVDHRQPSGARGQSERVPAPRARRMSLERRLHVQALQCHRHRSGEQRPSPSREVRQTLERGAETASAQRLALCPALCWPPCGALHMSYVAPASDSPAGEVSLSPFAAGAAEGSRRGRC